MQPLIDVIHNVIGKQENGAKKPPKNQQHPKTQTETPNPPKLMKNLWSHAPNKHD